MILIMTTTTTTMIMIMLLYHHQSKSAQYISSDVCRPVTALVKVTFVMEDVLAQTAVMSVVSAFFAVAL